MPEQEGLSRWIQRANGLARSRLNHHRGRTEAQGIIDTLGSATIALNDGDEAQAYTLLCSVSDRLVKLGVHEHQMPWTEFAPRAGLAGS